MTMADRRIAKEQELVTLGIKPQLGSRKAL
jgi:hypothetical protein